MAEAVMDTLGYRTTPEMRARRCDKCGGQPWTVCFWWDTTDGPSGCPEDGNVFTCGVALLQKQMHELRAEKETTNGLAAAIRDFFGDDTKHGVSEE